MIPVDGPDGSGINICEADGAVLVEDGQVAEATQVPGGFAADAGEPVYEEDGSLFDEQVLVSMPVNRDADGKLVVGWRECEFVSRPDAGGLTPPGDDGEPGGQDVELDTVIMSSALWPIDDADSLEKLFARYSVVIGEVVGIELPFDPRPGYDGVPPDPAPSGHPKAELTPQAEEIARPPGRLFTVYSVKVEKSLTPSIAAGTTINVGQSGGEWDGKSYQMLGNPPLRVGNTYLLSLEPSPTVTEHLGSGYFLGVPFAQFLLSSGDLRPLDDSWSDLPAVLELSGVSREQAASRISEAKSTDSTASQ
jgi:hypothetical protein